MDLQNQMVKKTSQLMAFTFITEILICWKLWFPIDREFPMISAFSWLDFSIGTVGDGILSLALLIALVFVLINKNRKLAIIMTLSCLFVLALEDINRFQPWVYTQGAILTLIYFYKQGRENAIQSGVMLVVALVYIWSGIQKLNLGFLRDTFPWILSAFGLDFQNDPGQPLDSFNYLFSIVPILEFSIGLFLLISKTRKIGIIIGLLMHLFILLSLGPTGHNWNIIVFPWNLSLILLLILFHSPKEHIKIIKGIKSLRLNYVILILFGLMPILNFIGYWDDTLSATMYSGTHSNVAFYFDTKSKPELPKFRKAGTVVTENSESGCSISKTWFMYWSVYDIKVPFYPANRYYKRFGRKLCKETKTPLKSGIEITTRSKFTGAQTITKCSCLSLLESDD
jgi:hypothetical protein